MMHIYVKWTKGKLDGMICSQKVRNGKQKQQRNRNNLHVNKHRKSLATKSHEYVYAYTVYIIQKNAEKYLETALNIVLRESLANLYNIKTSFKIPSSSERRPPKSQLLQINQPPPMKPIHVQCQSTNSENTTYRFYLLACQKSAVALITGSF